MTNPNWRVAIYAEGDVERLRLKEYVTGRGWTCWGREYALREWKELISDATTQRFHAICASFDGLWWFAPVTREVECERVLPKRGTPPGPPKGSVIGGRRAAEELAVSLITERGPQTLDDVTRAVIAAGLGDGSPGSVRNIVRFALNGSDRLSARHDRDGSKRWRLRPASRESITTPPDPTTKPGANIQLPPVAVHAIAQVLAESLARELIQNPPEQLRALLAGHATGHAEHDRT